MRYFMHATVLAVHCKLHIYSHSQSIPTVYIPTSTGLLHPYMK